LRETRDIASLILNPLGTGVAPLTSAERHQRMMSPLFPDLFSAAVTAMNL